MSQYDQGFQKEGQAKGEEGRRKQSGHTDAAAGHSSERTGQQNQRGLYILSFPFNRLFPHSFVFV